MLFWFLALALHASSGQAQSRDQIAIIKAMNYLVRYNYMPTGSLISGEQRTHEVYVKSIKRFQDFANLKVTGELDAATLEKMAQPRCGVPDVIWSDNTRRRRKRYAFQGTRWNKKHLTYSFMGLTYDIPNYEAQKNEMRRAFKLWEDNSQLTFEELDRDNNADIRINFYRYYHQDGNPFDGPGGTLAHGFYPHDNVSPISGDVHFDDDETWDISGDRTKIDLFQVAAHEIGHSLGLAHSSSPGALMLPFYAGYIPNFKLPEDDKRAIQMLYGVPAITRPTTIPPRSFPVIPGFPHPCEAQMDAAFYNNARYGGNDRTYAFVGKFVLSMSDDYLDEKGYPKLIQDVFEDMEGPIDAALLAPNGETFFFIGREYWKYRQFKKIGGPFNVSDWKNFPRKIGAAMIWRPNGKIYLFRGSKYWRVDQHKLRVDLGYPRKIKSAWTGVPTHVDAAVQWKNGHSYFFKGKNYYKLKEWQSVVETGYPKNVHRLWMGCPEAVSAGQVSEEVANIEEQGNN